MKKIATITFHSSYNYGSNLQAYALQEYIKQLFNYKCDYKIINLRSNIQKKMYELPFVEKNFKSFVKYLILIKYVRQLKDKQSYFEKFINNNLCLTEEYHTLEDLKKQNFKFDYYISGSDQLWNLYAIDFDWSYFLEFIKKGKKISYAASFGPSKQKWTKQDMERIKLNLKQYDYLSVREKGSYDNVFKLTNRRPNINIDPTMLLTKEMWFKIIDKKKKINKEYILLYNLKDDVKCYKIADKISKKIKLPVVVTKIKKYDFYYNVEKYYDCGPLEFLNVLKNAKLVLTTSFHGTVFSILFNKPFFTVNCENDFRIRTLLETTNLEDRNIENDDIEEYYKKLFEIDFKKAEVAIELEREKSREYLKEALDIKE